MAGRVTAVLTIGKGVTLPLEAATETFGILAKRGAGKSNAAVVMAEEMWAAGIPWVAIDPKGDWWGVRSSADGKRPGLALPVFGGEHGDLPLEPRAGALVADLIVDNRLTSVLDVSEFSKGDARRFLIDFAERLLKRNREPLHLFLEEAHEYLPQRVMRDEAYVVGAWSKVVKQGRFRGLGCTLISQRSASLNKDVLTQVDTLIVMRTTAPQDRKAVEAWVVEHDYGHDLVSSLPTLADGEAWIWSPEFLKTTRRVKFRRRSTFDSGATPKVGAKRQAVATLADVDLAEIKEAMADTIERATADNPKILRTKIAELQREVEGLRGDVRAAEHAYDELNARVVQRLTLGVEVGELVYGLIGAVEEVKNLVTDVDRALSPHYASTPELDDPIGVPEATGGSYARGGPHAKIDKAVRDAPRPAWADGDKINARIIVDTGAPELGTAELRVLTVLARYGTRTGRQIALLTGYSPRASTIPGALASLRKRGYVSGHTITDSGRTAAGVGGLTPLPTGPALLDHWRATVSTAERKVLDVVVDAHPVLVTLDGIARRTGYSPAASTIPGALATLRNLGLMTGFGLSDDFAAAIR